MGALTREFRNGTTKARARATTKARATTTTNMGCSRARGPTTRGTTRRPTTTKKILGRIETRKKKGLFFLGEIKGEFGKLLEEKEEKVTQLSESSEGLRECDQGSEGFSESLI